MAYNTTEIVFVLDRSGSMAGLESDTIGGFNGLLNKQKGDEGEAYVTTVLFYHEQKLLHDRLPIKEVPEMTDRDYVVRGSTALLDAVGDSISRIEMIHKYIRKEDVPAKTLFVITTDGMENSSDKYTAQQVKALISRKTEEGWEFLFLGANIDAVSSAQAIGIKADRAVNYHSDTEGTAKNFRAMEKAVSAVRKNQPLAASAWRDEVDADFNRRK